MTFEQLKLKQVQEKSGLEFLFYLRKEKKMKKKICYGILHEKIAELS